MKKVKYIVCFFLLLFCLILNSELYQSYLESYTSVFNYMDIGYFIGREYDKDIMQAVKESTKKNNIKFFIVDKKVKSAFSTELSIFCDEETELFLSDKYEITSGSYESLFSGKTDVLYKAISEAKINEDNSQRFYFIGDIEGIRLVREDFAENYTVTLIKNEDKSINQWLAIGVWTLLCLMIVLLTRLDIQFQKKEAFVLLSLGKDKWKIIGKNILIDTTVLSIMFSFIKCILSFIAYTDYNIDITMIMFIVTLAANALLYFSMLKLNFKQVLYGANLKSSLLSDCYVIKAVSMIVTVAVLSVNIVLVIENGNVAAQYKKIDYYEDYKFITYSLKNPDPTNFNLWGETETKIFKQLYDKVDVKFSYSTISGDDCRMIVMDKESAVHLAGLPEDEINSMTDDYRVYAPDDEQKLRFAEENYTFPLNNVFPLSGEVKGDIATYYDNKEVICFDVQPEMGEINGFAVEENPIIMVCNFDKENMTGESFNGLTNTMFLITEEEIAELESSEAFKALGVEIETMGVVERCNEYRANVMRTLLLSSVISVFMLLLELAIITTIIKLEYTINATESAIKKVIGYSVYKRNKTIFLLNLFAALIGVLTVVVAALMASFAKLLGLSQWYTVVLAGVGLLVLEWPVMLYYINKTEKTNIPKILKGGSL